MSIAIAIAVSDGIALAAETQTTWSRTIDSAKEKDTGREVVLELPLQVPVGWSKMARKLFKITIGGVDYALATAGAALINKKTPYSIFKHLEVSYSGPPEFDSVLTHLLDGMKEQMRQHHGVSDLTHAPILVVDIIFARFADQDVSKPIVANNVVYSGQPTIKGITTHTGDFRRWANADSNHYGGCWVGGTEFISHIVINKNPDLPQISGQYELMTLADAVDYTTFLVRFTCDFQRFAIMVPDVGRPIVSATLTPEGFTETLVET
jgi:hypothetical protein